MLTPLFTVDNWKKNKKETSTTVGGSKHSADTDRVERNETERKANRTEKDADIWALFMWLYIKYTYNNMGSLVRAVTSK